MAEPRISDRITFGPLSRWLLGYAWPHRRKFAVYIGLMFGEVLLGLLVPWPMKVLVDNVLGGNPLPAWAQLSHSPLVMLAAVCLAGLLIGLVSELVSLAHTQLQVGLGQRMLLCLQQDLFGHLQKLSLRYHQQAGTGDTIYRLDSDSFCVDAILMNGFFPLANSLLTLGLMFVVLFRLEWSVALLSLAVIPLLFVVIHRYSGRITDRAEQVKEMESGLYNLVHEVFSSVKLVKAFARELYELGRFTQRSEATLKERLGLTFQESLFSVTITSLTYLGTALVLGLGGWRVLQGRMTVGELLVVTAYLGAVYGPLSSISHTMGALQGSMASARRVYETLHTEPESEERPTTLDAPILRGDLRFEQVSFAYQASRPVLEDISFTVKPGQMVALVGLTGAGKTTLVSLIPRFYEPTAGRVLLDGVDVLDRSLKAVREGVSFVLQEPILFSASIADNIRYGRLDATHEEIEAAAQDAQAHEFISELPDGYATELGEDGAGLSGGERQRLSIARALLKDAPVLILDEPTSSLDARSEAKVFAALRRLMEGRTTIVIAHRLSTIRDADNIIVLENGRIAGQGRHEDLLASNALYRELCERLSLGLAAVEHA